ncbi:MAG: alanine racemase [Acidobacteria bacterium]|nr:alanine racemase [Acidobacteriota bacterium]
MITKPTLILDEEKCRANIRTMYEKALLNKLDFRPHFKTHQSLEIGRWFKELGVDKITVSSIKMANYFAGEWDDITIAFPVNILEIDAINSLAERIGLNLLIESVESTHFLSEHLEHNIGVFIKVDVGYHRTGVDPNNTDLIDRILDLVEKSPKLTFKGFLTHPGHSYDARSIDRVLEIHDTSLAIMAELKSRYLAKYPEMTISIGDTPTCSLAEDFTDIDEIRPGNFVFYDLTQVYIGACALDKVAVAMVCPVVAIHRERDELVIYGGGVHFSKDRIEDESCVTVFGQIVESSGKAWGKEIEGMYVKSLSQEHGVISVPRDKISNYTIGDELVVIPVHSCMTADVTDRYLTTDAKFIERL